MNFHIFTQSLLVVFAACAMVSLAPPSVHGQNERPSIRISGGHVYLGGRHAGSIGVGRDPHAAGRLIRGRLFEMGDPRAARFGPGRLPDAPGFTRYPWWIHPRTVPAPAHRPRFVQPHPFRPWAVHPFWPRSGHPLRPGLGWQGHPVSGVVILLHHPFGPVWLAHGIGWWRWMEFTTSAVGAPSYGVAEGELSELPGGKAPAPATPRAPAPRARPAPYEPAPERCADVTVELLAGAVQRLRVDMSTAGTQTPEELRAALEGELRYQGRLDIRGARGDGLVAPAALVRSLDVEACEP